MKNKVNNLEANKKKNPLNVLFGRFLQVCRKKTGFDASEFALELGLGYPYMRMTESGNVLFQSKHCLSLVQFLVKRGIQIELSMTVKFVGAIHILQGDKKEGSSWSSSLNELSEADADFEKLFDRISTFLNNSENADTHPTDLDLYELSSFLGNAGYGSMDTERFTQNLLNTIFKIPSFTLDIILGNMLAFGRYSLQMGDGVRWENDNKHRITAYRAVHKSKKGILNPEALNRFPHLYLRSKVFEKMEYVFLDGGLPVQVKEKLVQTINDAWEELRMSPLTSEEVSKIHVVCVPSNKVDNTISDIFRVEKNLFDSFWAVTTTNGNHIGFMGTDAGSLTDIPAKSVLEKSSTFDRVFRNFS